MRSFLLRTLDRVCARTVPLLGNHRFEADARSPSECRSPSAACGQIDHSLTPSEPSNTPVWLLDDTR